MVKASQLPDETEFIETHSEEGDGQRKWTVAHHAEEIQRYDNIERVYVRPAGRTGGLFSHHQGNGGCLFAVQLALLFSPHLFLSFFLILLFFLDSSHSGPQKRDFFPFFFLQRMQYKLFLFICGASKHLNISSIFP